MSILIVEINFVNLNLIKMSEKGVVKKMTVRVMPMTPESSIMETPLDRVDIDSIEFKEIFNNGKVALFKMVTHCMFRPEQITLEMLQKYSKSPLQVLDQLHGDCQDQIKKKLVNKNFVYAFTPNGIQTVQTKNWSLGHKPFVSTCNDNARMCYFITKVKIKVYSKNKNWTS